MAAVAAVFSALSLVAPTVTMADGKADLLPPVKATILGTPLNVGDLGLRGGPLAQAVPEPVREVARDTTRGVALEVEPLDTAVAVEEKKDLSARTRPIVDEATVPDQDSAPTQTEAPVVGRSENSLGGPRAAPLIGPRANPDAETGGTADFDALASGPREQALAAVEQEWSTVPKYLAAVLPLLVAMLILLAILTRRRGADEEPILPIFERRRHAR